MTQPRIFQSVLAFLYEGTTWLHEIPLGAYLFETPKEDYLEEDIQVGGVYLPVNHLNQILYNLQVEMVNEEYSRDPNETPNLTKYMNFNEWTGVGVNTTEPMDLSLLTTVNDTSNRLLALMSKGDFTVSNYWGSAPCKGRYCWFVLKMVDVSKQPMSFGVSQQGTNISQKQWDHKVPAKYRVVPHVFAVTTRDMCIPRETRVCTVNGKEHIGPAKYVGMCTENAQYVGDQEPTHEKYICSNPVATLDMRLG